LRRLARGDLPRVRPAAFAAGAAARGDAGFGRLLRGVNVDFLICQVGIARWWRMAMAGVGGSRSHTESRKKARQHFHYSAKILTDQKEPPRPCLITDISESGARLLLDKNDKLPDRFMLLLSARGEARRRCRVIWREDLTVGVAFMSDEI
jgi:hypothetical protein